jgi:cobalt-zinc-cadmium efflux system outer membrane protein
MKTMTWAAGVIVMTGCMVAAAAESTNAPQATVAALVREALARNPELKFYDAELQAAKAGRKGAGLWPNPELSSSVARKEMRASDMNAEGVAWSVSLMQPFEWPGRIGLRKAIANRDIELAELGLERFKTALASRVRVLAYTAFAAQQKAAAAQEVADRFKLLRDVLVQRDAAGITPLLETRVIEATEVAMQRKAAEAAVAMQAAVLELNQIRGAEPTARVVVNQGRLRFQDAVDLKHLLSLAYTNNFDLRVREVELAQQGLRVSLAKNERFPALSVGPMYSEERAGDRERMIGVGISAPLPLWSRNGPAIETAQARQLQAETSLVVTRREVERKVAQAVASYQRHLRSVSQWRPDSGDYFRQAADLADRHYRLGAVPIATYMDLQQNYLEAVEALVDSRKDALEAAAELEVLTGLTPPLATVADEEKQ